MDRRTHANVMMKFANKLSLSDPLQTLYQLMSGRQPSSVTVMKNAPRMRFDSNANCLIVNFSVSKMSGGVIGGHI